MTVQIIMGHPVNILNWMLGNETTCFGDSGGPLVVQSEGRFIQIGITSFGSTDCSGPSVFSTVAYSLDWISAVISSSL